ncbi:phosphoribosyltransferase [Hansschlegelia zhihuaiae]|uniref:Phosphoribosyltransferase n=1 Tax=Hansschlegelia zhihuaiae TaxID=405005 RepID=A0A4Q0M409_9HYPH|nr:phosphoribosyltransferase [Hansschlegelia zhihuaiae]RXF67429.1 phosphoribosyltransferase [Hansschlegelia zhihuaiae]
MRRPVGEFADRRDAGRRLADALTTIALERPLVLALPRGGVPVGFEVAEALDADLELLIVRKLGATGFEEFGLGAVVDGAEPQVVLNEGALAKVSPPAGYVDGEIRRQLREIERRRAVYRCDRAPISAAGRTVIVVDDGVATGGTARAALKGVRRTGPKRLVLAVPVGPKDVCGLLAADADEAVVLGAPPNFRAVGLHYRDFAQTTDEEVIRLVGLARQRGRRSIAATS